MTTARDAGPLRSALAALAALTALIMLVQPVRAGIEIAEVTSPGGIDAWLVEEHSIPFVAIEIRFRGGASMEPLSRRGVTNLMVGLLEEGTGTLDAQGFARAVDETGASFEYETYDDSVAVSARMLTETRSEAVELLRASLVAPSFDPVAIERVRGQVLLGIRSDMKDPAEIARQTFNREAFGPDHPYGSPLTGTLETVQALDRDDILAAHRGVLTRAHLYVSAVGDITPAELGALLDRLLGELPASGWPLPPRATVRLHGGVTVVPFPTPQSVAVFGHEGIERRDPRFFAAYVLNTILGGGNFENRLMREVREKRGLTYGIGTFLVPRDLAALLIGQLASANDRMARAIEVVAEEWRRVAAEGVTAEELDRAKTYLTGAYPLRFDGNGRIANILVGMQMDGLSPDYVKTRNARIMAVTLDEVNRVARELLKPEALHFTVVGRPEGLPATTSPAVGGTAGSGENGAGQAGDN